MNEENKISIQDICKTQTDDNPIYCSPDDDPSTAATVNVGYNAIAPRWRHGTTLRFFVDPKGFPSATDHTDTARAMRQAAGEWNRLQFGVSVTEAASRDTAHFEVVYNNHAQNAKIRRLAQAFFPHELNRTLYVTDYGLSAPNRPMLKDVLVHELGHILGLRHDYAHRSVGEMLEGTVEQLTSDNPKSVMNSHDPVMGSPTMQNSDIIGIRKFYALKSDEDITTGGLPVIVTDYKPKLLKP